MLAVLAAVTEIIKTQGGQETEVEYFAILVSYKGTRVPYVIVGIVILTKNILGSDSQAEDDGQDELRSGTPSPTF